MLVAELSKSGEEEELRESVTTFLVFLYMLLSLLLLSLELAHIFRSSLGSSSSRWHLPNVLFPQGGSFQQAFNGTTFQVTWWLDEQEHATVRNDAVSPSLGVSCEYLPARRIGPQTNTCKQVACKREGEDHAYQSETILPFAKEADDNSAVNVKKDEPCTPTQCFQNETQDRCLKEICSDVDNEKRQSRKGCNQQRLAHLQLRRYTKEPTSLKYYKCQESQDSQNPSNFQTKPSQNLNLIQYKSPTTSS